MAAADDIQVLLKQLGMKGKLRIAEIGEWPSSRGSPVLELPWPDLDAVLPDGGLPRGVVEFAAPGALGGSTSVALAAVRAGQARGAQAWCAWLDPEASLHAPGVVAAGVDLARMLVVHVPRVELARVAVKVVASGAFEVVVIDFDAVPGAKRRKGAVREEKTATGAAKTARRHMHGWAPEVVMRKLALAAEPSGSTVIVLTNASEPRCVPWPVALRVELSRPNPRDLVVRVAKDRRGRIGVAKSIPFRPALAAV